AGLVDYGAVIDRKGRMLDRTWDNFQGGAAPDLRSAFAEFRGREAGWLDDFALYLALKEEQGGGSWYDWPADLLLRKPAALAKARDRLRGAIGREQFGQFRFLRQWQGP